MRGHRLNPIGKDQNVSFDADRATLEALRAARPAQAFVMLIDAICHRPGKINQFVDVISLLGVIFQDFELNRRRPSRFGENCRWNGNFADIMQFTHDPQPGLQFVAQAKLGRIATDTLATLPSGFMENLHDSQRLSPRSLTHAQLDKVAIGMEYSR